VKFIKPSNNENHWPRHASPTIQCRKKDLVVRIADWTEDKDEPAYDVEVIIGGIYDWNESKVFAFSSGLTKAQAKQRAIEYAAQQIAKLL